MLSNLQVCFNAVMPLFLIMGLGYGVKCLGGIRVEDVPGLNKMAFRFFMPVMLFWNLYTSSIDQALQPKLLLFAVGATLVMYGLSLAIVLPTEKDHEKQGVKIQGTAATWPLSACRWPRCWCPERTWGRWPCWRPSSCRCSTYWRSSP